MGDASPPPRLGPVRPPRRGPIRASGIGRFVGVGSLAVRHRRWRLARAIRVPAPFGERSVSEPFGGRRIAEPSDGCRVARPRCGRRLCRPSISDGPT